MCLLQVGCSSLRTNIIIMSRGKEGILVPGGSLMKPKKTLYPRSPASICYCDTCLFQNQSLLPWRTTLELRVGSASLRVPKLWWQRLDSLKRGTFGKGENNGYWEKTNNVLCISCSSFVLSSLSLFSIHIPGVQEAITITRATVQRSPGFWYVL